MSYNSNKKKSRTNINNKLSRRTSAPRTMTSDGVYANSRLMHAATSLVGCTVQIQVKNGAYYEGIFRTFSNELEMVLSIPHKLDEKCLPAQGLASSVSNLLGSFPFEENNPENLVFKLKDVVSMSAFNVDLDYAIKDNFTDTAISKFNGQVSERELEPWEGPSGDADCLTLDPDENNGANGWDANDMFRLNAERYGVTSTYDNTLQEYTVPLTKRNTDEYRKREAEACKIAQEIEANTSYQSHIQLENGDEEDRFSAVVRPENTNPLRYVTPQRRNYAAGAKRPMTLNTSSPIPQREKPFFQSSSNHGGNSPNQTTMPSKRSPSPPSVHIPSPPIAAAGISNVSNDIVMDRTINGEELKEDERCPTTVTEIPPPSQPAVKMTLSPIMPQTLSQRPDRRRDERKYKQKGRDDEIEEFKKFSSSFKLTDECKEDKEDFSTNLDSKIERVSSKMNDMKTTEKMAETEEDRTAEIVKASTLNPNAKEFVLNPNAKSFTPRSMAVTSPHTPMPLQPQRISQSPIMAMSHGPMVHGMGQPVFTAIPPQYIMQAPVSMALTTPFGTLSQGPRIRKIPLMPPRHDISPSMHVAAATGQPILAPSPMSNPSQMTMQYTPPPGMMHASGPPQQTMGYPQMSYVVGPRGMSPQPVGMVPTSHTVSYDAAHLNAHLFMSAHPSAAALSAVSAAHSMQQGAGGQHSNQHPPQSHTPVIHHSPSPVHQPPPNHVNPSQPPTQTTIMYPGQMNHQHPMQAGHPHHHHHHHNANQQLNAHVAAHHTNFSAGPQPVVLMQQQAMPGSHSHHSGPHPLHLHSLHGQNPGNHIGGPTQVMSQMSVIPTSAAMVTAPNSMVTSPFVQHPQGV